MSLIWDRTTKTYALLLAVIIVVICGFKCGWWEEKKDNFPAQTSSLTQSFPPAAPVQPPLYSSGDEINITVAKEIFSEKPPELHKTYIALTRDDDTTTGTYTVARMIKNECDIAEVINELLKGPTSDERKQGFETAIPKDVKLISAGITDWGEVHVKFSKELQIGGGSAWVNMIRSQIEHSIWLMKCYQDVPNLSVVIEIDGVPLEEVLQP